MSGTVRMTVHQHGLLCSTMLLAGEYMVWLMVCCHQCVSWCCHHLCYGRTQQDVLNYDVYGSGSTASTACYPKVMQVLTSHLTSLTQVCINMPTRVYYSVHGSHSSTWWATLKLPMGPP